MLKVVEAFSGIGSQAKALKNIGIDFEIVNTIDWDINAIIAYDLIHNGRQDLSHFNGVTKEILLQHLSKYTLSLDGKQPIDYSTLNRMPLETLSRLYYAIIRTKNLINIKDVHGSNFPFEIDILTYSFPCQDLSISGFWHGNRGGIDRNANNRSSTLWEIERILFEMEAENQQLPKFLLMENVTSIRSRRHIKNFTEWQTILEKLGYENIVYDLCAYDFGIPQKRKRTFMISVYVGEGNTDRRTAVKQYFKEHNLEENPNLYIEHTPPQIKDFLKMDYSNPVYKSEAIQSIPNCTQSRQKIYSKNPKIYKNKNGINHNSVRTITTKQDRHPNSGVIEHEFNIRGKSNFRFLTPRECFIFMGFSEEDYDLIINNNFDNWYGRKFFTKDKLIKMAGNSIVVNVLESIFIQINEINKMLSKVK